MDLRITIKKLSGTVLRLIAGTLALSCLVSVTPSFVQGQDCVDDRYTECRGQRKVEYLVKDIHDLDRPYAYLIKGTKYWILEAIGALLVFGTIGFAVMHGLGRFLAHKRKPIELEKQRSVFIYKLFIRIGHWFNAFAVMILIVSGFLMHYVGPSHLLARIHNTAGVAFVIFWLAFFVYEVTSFDYKQFLVDDWELREGIFRQTLFYIFGIFKQEEHPYHMQFAARLNPLQKVAYFSVMFFLVPLVGFTGMVLLVPNMMSFFVNFIGLENMKYVYIFHLGGAFAMVAYLLGHLYLGTTGDKILQHYKVMITGYHDEYRHKSMELIKK